MHYLNLSAYKFIQLEVSTLPSLRYQLKQWAVECGLKGTILLSSEGINLFLAATAETAERFQQYLKTFPVFADIWFKVSQSEYIPFKRMIVRIKSEIITMKQPHVQPAQHTAPYLEPKVLEQWYDQKKAMVLLDTRNTYEFTQGTFAGAIHLHIEQFSQFPQAVSQLPESYKDQPIVTFCTGGIRCEKAAEYLLQQGFKQVWQLKGGILNYFEQCGGKHFEGNCFVFDERGVLFT